MMRGAPREGGGVEEREQSCVHNTNSLRYTMFRSSLYKQRESRN